MTVMNFDLDDGLPPVSFALKPADANRFAAFMADCQQSITKSRNRTAMGWTNVEDLAPESGSNVFAFWQPRSGYPVHGGCFGVATYVGGQWHNPEDDEDEYSEPSHWMPLPSAPITDAS